MRYVALEKIAKINRTVATEQECAILPYVGLEHIEKGIGCFGAEFECKPDPSLLATKFKFSAKHVLYGKLRPYLNKVALPTFEGVCTTEILPILPVEEKLDRAYLWAFLLSPKFVKWASASVAGANLPRLSPALLAKYEIPLPPLDEQRRIAATLARADRLRRLRRTAADLGATYLQSLFLRMFGDLFENPKSWKFHKLGAIADIASGVTKGRKFGDQQTSILPYLRVANVQDGYLDLSEIKMIEALPSDLEKLRLQAGDVLMTEGGDFDKLGRGAIWGGGVENCIHQNHIFRVRLNHNLALPEFFEKFLLTRYAKSYFLTASKQTTNLATINMTQLKALLVPLPPLPLQHQFAAQVHRFERLRAQQREAARQAEHLFQTLLQRAFAGE